MQTIRRFKTLVLLPFLLVEIASAAADGTSLTVLHSSYGGDPQIKEQDGQYASAIPSINTKKTWRSGSGFLSQIGIDSLAVLPLTQNVDFVMAVPEIYYQIEQDKLISFTFGRKKENWSILDSYWGLGLWQPLVRWDAASPIEQGLTGLFFKFGDDSKSQLLLMVSGVFLPDQQSNFEEKNGQMISSNRWFRAPVSSANLQGGSGQIKYHLIEPDYKEVIAQNSYAAMFKLGDLESGFFGKASVTDKPANQFHLGIETAGILNLTHNEFNADIYPVVIRHKIYSLETGYKWEYSSFVFSTNWENYETPKVSETWQQTELIDSRYDGIIFKQSLNPFGIKRASTGLSYIRRSLNDESSSATLIKGDIEASTQRFAFDEMVGIQVDANLIRTFKRQIDLRFKYTYSIFDSGEWVQAGVQLKLGQSWMWNLSGDIFGVPHEALASSSFISKYRGNDRISGSLTYVF